MGDLDAVTALYESVLTCWNSRDAAGYGALFADDASLVGFDGSCVETAPAITEHLQSIFADHEPGAYVWKVREVRELGPDVALLRSVVGMVPPGASDIKAEVNAVQAMVAVHRADRWRIAHLQSTPAAFHGRPEEVDALANELRGVQRSVK